MSACHSANHRFACRWPLLLATGILWLAGFAMPAVGEQPPPIAETPVQPNRQWLQAQLKALGASSYTTRMAAMNALIQVGPPAIAMLTQELERSDDAEFQLRGLAVLEQLAYREISLRESPARMALQRLHDSQDAVLSGRAGSRLHRVAQRRRQFAIQRLRDLGAKVSEDPRLRQLGGMPELASNVTLDSASWVGTDDDARLLTDLETVNEISLIGPQITDAYLPPVGQLGDLVRLSLKNTRITDEGLAQLVECDDLADLEIRYADITDASIETLAKMNLHDVELTGTRITASGIAALEASLPGTNIDFKSGAYLGVGAAMTTLEEEVACRITTVQLDSAAARAGLMIGDVITHYNGDEVTDFESLRKAIAKNRAGDRVTIKWLRRGKPFQAEVELGAWE